MAPVSARAHYTPFFPPTPRGGLLDHVTRIQRNSFSEKGFDASTPTPPARPESTWAPLLLSLPLGLSPPNPHPKWGAVTWTPSSRQEAVGTTGSHAGPAPSPPGRQAAFPQPSSLKPNPSFQLQHERAPGPAFPGDPAACRSHGQGIFPVQCSKSAEPPAQRAGRDSNRLPHFTNLFPPQSGGRGDPVDRGCSLEPGAGGQGRPRGQRLSFLGRLEPWEVIPGGAPAQISLWQFPFLPVLPSTHHHREETHLPWP